MKAPTLSEILRQKMAEEGLPYYAIADKLGLPVCSTWRFMTGNGGLSLRHVERLMEHYKLGVVELNPEQRKGRKHGKPSKAT